MASAEVMNGIAEDGEEWSWDSPISVAPAYTLPSSPQNKQSLDFSHITPAQLGISTQSFIPSSNGKDKTRVSQLKAKRRSTVGVRGSPETNSLIRYIAQQRLKSPAVTPQPLQASPFYPRGLSSLKQKMASFQNLLEVEEDPKQAEQKETGGGSPVLGKENVGPQGHPLPAGPPSSKKPRVGPLTEKAGEAAQATPPFLDLAPLHSRCHPEQHQVEQTTHVESSADSVRRLCSEQLESSQVDSEKPSPVEITRCQTEEVACGSPGRSPGPRRIDQNAIPLTPTRCTPTKEQWTWTTAAESPCLDPPGMRTSQSLPFPPLSPLATHPTAHTSACPGATSTQQQKKRVRFGAPLSPEFFDKCLPPSTPLQKGGTPAPAPASGGSQLRSLLKTPQRCGPALPQPDFSSPSLADPSPPVTSLEEEEEGKVTAPVVAEESVGSPEDRDVAPLVRKTLAQRRSPLPKTTPGSPQTPSRLKETAEVDTVPDPIPNSTPEPTPEPLIGPTPEQPVGPSPASKQPIGPIPAEPTGPAPAARSRGRKRKQPEENNTAERKRPSRSAAISASGKMKGSTGKRRWGSKEVDRSLYGKRDYASKNPTLSPITEALSSGSRSPTPRRRENGRPPLGEVTVSATVTAAAMWRQRFHLPTWDRETTETRPSFDSTEAAEEKEEGVVEVKGRVNRAGRPRGRGRGRGRGRRDSAPYAGGFKTEGKVEGVSNGDVGQNSEDQRKARMEPSLYVLPGNPRQAGSDGLATHTDTQEPYSPGPEGGDLIGCDTEAEHGAEETDTQGESGAPSDAGSSEARSLLTDGEQDAAGSAVGRGSNGGRRSGALGRPKGGRRSSLFRPRITEDDETQEQVHPVERGIEGIQERGGEATEEREVGMTEQREVRVMEERGEGTDLLERLTGGGEELVGEEHQVRAEEAGANVGVATVSVSESERDTEAEHAQAPPFSWQQADFSIEDVLQPLPRGRRSVRRSLRNQSRQDPTATGLAWLPHGSPSPSSSARRPTRRKTQGRRLSAAHAPPTLLEDPPSEDAH